MFLSRLARFFRIRHHAEIVSFDVAVAETSSEREILRSLGVASLKQFEKMHHLDPNMPMDELEQIDAAIRQGNAEKGVEIEHLIVEDNSPYPEVSERDPPPAFSTMVFFFRICLFIYIFECSVLIGFFIYFIL